MDREAIEHLESFSMDQATIEKGSSNGSIDSLAIERCPVVVEITQTQFFKKRKP